MQKLFWGLDKPLAFPYNITHRQFHNALLKSNLTPKDCEGNKTQAQRAPESRCLLQTGAAACVDNSFRSRLPEIIGQDAGQR